MNVHSRRHATLRRRGVTLVEMLITLAVLLLMMALIVQIFQAATGSMSAAQAYQRLDDDLRRLDSTLRADLDGATARFTPPLDPADGLGYFEYVENEFADNQGEDCDDSIRLTVKAPEGRPFTGRMWAKPPRKLAMVGGTLVSVPGNFGAFNATSNPGGMTPAEIAEYFKSQPITVTSEHAEVIYFLRNGNLYRRVLLVAPELQRSLVHSYSDASASNVGFFPVASAVGPTLEGPPTDSRTFTPVDLGASQVSFLGVNDLSARPASRGLATANGANNSVVLNKLSDLTDRHNRFASPRFSDDFVGFTTSGGSRTTVLSPDGLPDDANGDNVPDWYPTLYPHLIEDSVAQILGAGTPTTLGLWNVVKTPDAIYGDGTLYSQRGALAFPYVYRGAFSQAQYLGNDTQIGWIHAPAPFSVDPLDSSTAYQYNVDPVNYLRYLNHNPIDAGDNLPTPFSSGVTWNNLQTYWGFPTWRETLAPEWNDPTFQVNQPISGYSFPNGLEPLSSTEITAGHVDRTDAARRARLLPPMTADWRGASKFQQFTDGTGSDTGYFGGSSGSPLWASYSWEDDLILTNVRSFDVKAFEPSLADYADLGWGDDPRRTPAATTTGATYLGTGAVTPYLYGNIDAIGGAAAPGAVAAVNGSFVNVVEQTFAHEGRMPPLISDFRFDAQFGPAAAGTYASNPGYTGNLGDDSREIVRLRRVWDSWSTTYSKAPAKGVQPGGFPSGPPFSPPMYPSYPPPYPAPLRGIQVQVRVTDPTNQRIKVLTIRQDFTSKL